MNHAFSVDVEEHFQVHGFEGVVRREDWPRHESRVARNVEFLLDLCRHHGVRGTFFVLGWCAERAGAWLDQIPAEGHELASHGYAHELIYRQGREAFAEDLRRSLGVIEDRTRARVLGYRAPSYSITRRSLWAFEVLGAQGLRYDSSVYPIARRKYGIPDAPLAPYEVPLERGGCVVEFPMAAFQWGPLRIPAASGAYLRLFPAALHRSTLRRYAARGVPAVVSVHPWEVDPGQPRIRGPLRSRLLHYTGLARTASVLESLFAEFRFVPLRDCLAGMPSSAS